MVDAARVKELRDKTGAGMMDCKKALVETGGDMEKAAEHLREKGLAAAAKRASRAASEGIVDSYIHAGGKIGVLVEVNCETDFVARNQQFREFAHNIAMQIAATSPQYIKREDVPVEAVKKEEEFLRAQALNEGKPEKVVENIVQGRLDKYFKEICLLEQAYVKDPHITIMELMTQQIATIGENIVIRRFARFALGEETDNGIDE